MSKDTSTLIDGWSAFPTLTKSYATSAIGFTARLPPDSAIREYSITLYVGLAHAFPPTNTKFKPLLLPTQWVCHTQALTSTEHHISSLQSHFRGQLSAGSSFLPPDKNRKFLWFFIINILNFKIFFISVQMGFLSTP